MPKEQINYVRDRQIAVTEDGHTPMPDGVVQVMTDPTIHVNWLNSPEGGGHVQVMLEAPVSYVKMALESPNGDEADTTQLWSPVLDRSEINRMIRALRNARDKAYGRDE